MEPRHGKRDQPGCLLLLLLSLACAKGCAPAAEEGSGRRAGGKTAHVASVEAQEGQAFLVGALVPASPEGDRLRDGLRQAAQANHLALDVQPLGKDASAQTAQLARWREQSADGLLFCAPDTPALQTLLRGAADQHLPVVWMDTRASALTLFHDGKAIKKAVAPAPQTLSHTAVIVLCAALRGEKVRPTLHFPKPTF